MPLYTLKRQQHLPIDLKVAWRFFCEPRNLARITPDWLSFEVTSHPPVPLTAGSIICYRIRPLWRFAVSWTTEITHLEEPRLFVDEQRFGPYRFWHHLHRFDETDDGIVMTDIVHYRLYGGPLASPLHGTLVRPRLEAIFDYRAQVLGELFPGNGKAAAPDRAEKSRGSMDEKG